MQVKVKPVVIEAAAPAAASPKRVERTDTSWLMFFDLIRWTTAKEFATRAKIDREQARAIVRALELEGWLEHSEKHGWRRLHKQRQQTVERPAWGGVTHGVPSGQLLEVMSFAVFEDITTLAAKWGRTRDKTAYALAELRKRGVVQNDPRVGWRRVSKPTAPKVNGKHHIAQEQQH